MTGPAGAGWKELGACGPGELRVLENPVAVLGEAPLWDHRGGLFNWVDCDQRKLFTLDPAMGTVAEQALPGNPGSYAHRTAGGMISAYRNRLVLIDPAGTETAIDTSAADFAVERFNDGACDRARRFWVGTMHPRMAEPQGGLFRVGTDLRMEKMESGATVGNGIAFSPDDRFLYFTDSRAPKIYRYEFDLESGSITGRTTFLDFTGHEHRPDGCTIDSEGHLWAAIVGAGQIRRYDPGGTQVLELTLPVSRPTSVAFGGPDLSTLYITSMKFALSEDQLRQEPHAGCLFAWRSDIAGLPEPMFGG